MHICMDISDTDLRKACILMVIRPPVQYGFAITRIFSVVCKTLYMEKKVIKGEIIVHLPTNIHTLNFLTMLCKDIALSLIHKT